MLAVHRAFHQRTSTLVPLREKTMETQVNAATEDHAGGRINTACINSASRPIHHTPKQTAGMDVSHRTSVLEHRGGSSVDSFLVTQGLWLRAQVNGWLGWFLAVWLICFESPGFLDGISLCVWGRLWSLWIRYCHWSNWRLTQTHSCCVVLPSNIFFLILKLYCGYERPCLCHSAHVQARGFGDLHLPSRLTWVLGTELRSPDLKGWCTVNWATTLAL